MVPSAATNLLFLWVLGLFLNLKQLVPSLLNHLSESSSLLRFFLLFFLFWGLPIEVIHTLILLGNLLSLFLSVGFSSLSELLGLLPLHLLFLKVFLFFPFLFKLLLKFLFIVPLSNSLPVTERFLLLLMYRLLYVVKAHRDSFICLRQSKILGTV